MTDLSDILSTGHWAVLPPDLDPIETREWLDALEARPATAPVLNTPAHRKRYNR